MTEPHIAIPAAKSASVVCAYLNRKAAAVYLGISERWLSVLQDKHQIPFIKRGKMVRFQVKDLDAYMEQFRVSEIWESPTWPTQARAPLRRSTAS